MVGDAPINEGEGGRTAAREYNDMAREFARSGQVDKAARDAATALESGEAVGRAHIKDEDPQVHRDR